jgi:hypothetical protein
MANPNPNPILNVLAAPVVVPKPKAGDYDVDLPKKGDGVTNFYTYVGNTTKNVDGHLTVPETLRKNELENGKNYRYRYKIEFSPSGSVTGDAVQSVKDVILPYSQGRLTEESIDNMISFSFDRNGLMSELIVAKTNTPAAKVGKKAGDELVADLRKIVGDSTGITIFLKEAKQVS